MAISQSTVKVGISYTPKEGENPTHNIVYDGMDQNITIEQIETKEKMTISLKMFGEITDFLVRNKYLLFTSPEVQNSTNFPMSNISAVENPEEGGPVEDEYSEDDFEYEFGEDDEDEEFGENQEDDESEENTNVKKTPQKGKSKKMNETDETDEDITDSFLEDIQNFTIPQEAEAQIKQEKNGSANNNEKFKRGNPKKIPQDPKEAAKQIKQEQQLRSQAVRGKKIKRADG